MRETLFRGKSEDGLWYFGGLVTHDDTAYIVQFDERGNDVWKEVDPESVGQYTGLKDKNGREIFEGDIVLVHENDISNPAEVVYDSEDQVCCYCLIGYLGDLRTYPIKDFLVKCELEVIGNNFEHPHLLEERGA